MSKSIRLSEKHGVNPTVPICFWCGEEKNEVALLGKMKDDIEAPRSMVLDYEPCDCCRDNWAKGVTLLEVSDKAPDNRPPMKAQGDVLVYPTGRYLVIRPEAWKRMTDIDCACGDKTFIDKELFDRLSGGAE